MNRKHGYDAVTIASVQLANAAAISLVLAPFVAMTPISFRVAPTLCLVALGALGTGIAYALDTHVMTAWGSLAASTVTYVTPLVEVVLGIVVLGEHLTWHGPLGALVVILSVMLLQKRRPPTWPRRRASEGRR